ncbi:MAG: rhomboid family intramembrane serine protease [Gemmatimonadales bacterium]
MSEFRLNDEPHRRLTPWVGRLLAVNAVVLLLQQTIFTSGRLTDLLWFNSALALQRPWTFVTYMFVHAGILHLAANSLALFVFGPTVERRLGSTVFVTYYLYCGVVAAFVAMMLHAVGIGHLPKLQDGVWTGCILGASGAIIGVAYAFARLLPDAELMVFPLPMPVRARWLVAGLAVFDLVGLFLLNDNIAHEAHLGGLAAGMLFFVLRGISRPAMPVAISSPRPRMPVTAGSERRQGTTSAARRAAAPQAASGQRTEPDETTEIDRVLDKISAQGIESLTPDERRFLDSVARRRRDLPH